MTKLQQQVQGLADSQAALAKDIAALKQNTPSQNSINNGLRPVADSLSSPDAADTLKGFSNQAADKATQGNASSSSGSSPTTETVASTQGDGSTGTQLNKLTAEVHVFLGWYNFLQFFGSYDMLRSSPAPNIDWYILGHASNLQLRRCSCTG